MPFIPKSAIFPWSKTHKKEKVFYTDKAMDERRYDPEELRDILREKINALDPDDPKNVIASFNSLKELHSTCEDDEVLIEAIAMREYNSYDEAYEPESMKLILSRQMVLDSDYLQLQLTLEFKMNSYFEKYRPKKASFFSLLAMIFRSLFNLGNAVWCTSPRKQAKADRLIQDVLSHGHYLRNYIDFGSVE